MAKIRTHIYLIEHILRYKDMDDEVLKETYVIRCGQLNHYLDKLKEKGLTEESKTKRADKYKIPEKKEDLIKKLIELDTRMFTGRLLEIIKEEGEDRVRLFIAGVE